MFVWIQPDGTVRFLYDDALRGLLALGPPTIRRASHVEPTPDGQWTADLGPMDGPVLGPFETRAAALDTERAWLVHHFNSGHPGTGGLSCDPSRLLPPRPGTRPRLAPP
ncbi:MAG: hypothetical protein ACREJR_08390 [Candidatus Rokuibacteriota bacterium]